MFRWCVVLVFVVADCLCGVIIPCCFVWLGFVVCLGMFVCEFLLRVICVAFCVSYVCYCLYCIALITCSSCVIRLFCFVNVCLVVVGV